MSGSSGRNIAWDLGGSFHLSINYVCSREGIPLHSHNRKTCSSLLPQNFILKTIIFFYSLIKKKAHHYLSNVHYNVQVIGPHQVD